MRALRLHSPIVASATAALGLLAALARAQGAPAEPSTQLKPQPNAALPSLFVVGDSTARNNARGARGWGDPFVSYFDAAKINVFNRAMAGRSSRSYIAEGRWDQVRQEMKAGDFVLIQLGYNDGGAIDAGRAPR